MTEAWKLWEGQVVNGEFRLHQFVGGSEHSAVFLTEYGEPKPQKAAIKLIPAGQVSATRQLSQWDLATKLSHPHLTRLFRTGRCQLGGTEFLFVVMEYAAENLSQVLPQRPLTSAEVRELLGPALDALAYLHGQGLAHGHLKPANIMAAEDQLKLSSDRLCRIGESAADMETAGPYDPPEKARGAISSPAGDVWSLGMILAEALTQRLPVWESTGEEDPAMPEMLSAPFSEIVRNSLRRDPQFRWKVAEMAARLRQTLTAPQQPAAGGHKKSKQRFLVPAVVAGLALAALLGVSRLLHSGRENQGSAPAMDQTTPQTEPATQSASDQQAASIGTPQPPNPPLSETGAKINAERPEGEIVHQVLPDVSASARATITGKVKVKVKVQVDAAGNVTKTEFVSPGPSKYFARLAMQAAQGWKFSPSPVAAQDASRKWVLRFEFGRSGTRVFPARVAR